MDALTTLSQRAQKIILDIVSILPNLIIGLIVFMLFNLLSKRVRTGVAYILRRSGRSPTASLVIGRLARWGVVLGGFLVSLTIVLPTFNPARLIELLGISSVAIGFAFRDILQNFLAGILLVLTEPFKIGDQIIVGDYEGTVEDIQIRATYIKTYDGRRVVIPNVQLFTGSVIVNTAHEERRTEYEIGIGYGDDIDEAQALIVEALRTTEGILHDPAPDVIVVALAESSVTLRARWWTSSRLADVLRIRDRAMTHIKNTLLENGIDIPFPTQHILFHDQTEATDGDRAQQREGWPAGRQIPPPQRGISEALFQLARGTTPSSANGAEGPSS